MISQELDFLRMLWRRFVGTDFSSEVFLQLVRKSGGQDISDISHDQLNDLLEGRFTGDFAKVRFTFSEMLSSGASEASGALIVVWVFAVLMLADAMAAVNWDTSMEFNIFIDGFLKLRKHFTTEEWLFIFSRFLGSEHGLPPPTMDLYIADLDKRAAEMAAIISSGEYEKLSFWTYLSEDTQKTLLAMRDALNAGNGDTYFKLAAKGIIP